MIEVVTQALGVIGLSSLSLALFSFFSMIYLAKRLSKNPLKP
jgi:hypothetical protein